MSFKSDIRTLTTGAITELNELNAKIKDLESKKEGYYKPTYEAMMKELTDKRDSLILGTERKARELADAYKKSVKERFTPKGAELTDDAALLTSGLTLTGAELDALFDKHKGNNTMQRLIGEYAAKNEVTSFTRVVATEATYHEAADTMLAYTRNALQRPEYADIMLTDDYFAKITPDVMKED